MALRIEINKETCIGSGQCSYWAPAVFDIDDDEGVAVVIGDPAGHEDRVRLAEDGCPTGSISVTES
jgi:ferredoxin